jgi:hypothetical protein
MLDLLVFSFAYFFLATFVVFDLSKKGILYPAACSYLNPSSPQQPFFCYIYIYSQKVILKIESAKMFFGGYFQSLKLDQNLRKKFQQSIYGSSK